jgi:hypothetical protein
MTARSQYHLVVTGGCDVIRVLTPEECDAYRIANDNEPGTPLGVRCSASNNRDKGGRCLQLKKRGAAITNVALLKECANFRTLRTINIALLRSEEPFRTSHAALASVRRYGLHATAIYIFLETN